MRSPVNADYLCPFSNRTCSKLSHQLTAPFPVCSIYRRGTGGPGTPQARTPICVCPVRFFQADLVGDIVRECWTGDPPQTVRSVYEISMEKFGKVDMVVADIDAATGGISKFLPVELQAVDITGSYLPYYLALTESRDATKSSYGFNWANVRKRFISQLIAKGFYCHQWGTRIVAVIQEDLFTAFQGHAQITETNLASANIVFMLYQYQRESPDGPWTLGLRRVVPTTHNSVMSAILYEQAPNKSAFEQKILDRLNGQSYPSAFLHFALDAFLAMALRRAGVRASARAGPPFLPPFRPRFTASAFFSVRSEGGSVLGRSPIAS